MHAHGYPPPIFKAAYYTWQLNINFFQLCALLNLEQYVLYLCFKLILNIICFKEEKKQESLQIDIKHIWVFFSAVHIKVRCHDGFMYVVNGVNIFVMSLSFVEITLSFFLKNDVIFTAVQCVWRCLLLARWNELWEIEWDMIVGVPDK